MSMTFHDYHQPSLVTKKYQWRIVTQIMFSNFRNYSIEPCTCFWLAMFLCYAYVLVGWGKFFGFLRFLFQERNDVFMIHGQKQFRTRLRLANCVSMSSMSSLNMFKIIKNNSEECNTIIVWQIIVEIDKLGMILYLLYTSLMYNMICILWGTLSKGLIR